MTVSSTHITKDAYIPSIMIWEIRESFPNESLLREFCLGSTFDPLNFRLSITAYLIQLMISRHVPRRETYPRKRTNNCARAKFAKPMVQSSKRLSGLSNTEAGRIVSRHKISTCRFQEFSKISLMLHESPGVYQRRSSSINLEDPINPIFLNRDSIGSYLPVSATLLSSKPSAKFAHV
jgi:hypothetical protein